MYHERRIPYWVCYILELLRKSAEHTLMDMVQLLFSRLPQFKEDAKWAASMKKVTMLINNFLLFYQQHFGNKLLHCLNLLFYFM